MSKNLKAIGAGKILKYLLSDIKSARQSLFVVGPWIDSYFAEKIVSSLRKNISVKFLVRCSEHDSQVSRIVTLSSLSIIRNCVANFEARALSNLHAKAIIIDNKIIYAGSVNWYKYSLEHSLELTLRMRLSYVPGLKRILDKYWKEASPIPEKEFRIAMRSKPFEIDYEILDPLARKVLEENPKAFIKRIKK